MVGSEDGEKPGVWAVEDSMITLLEKKMSRVYAAPPAERLKAVYNTPPSKFETIDQVIFNFIIFFRSLSVLIYIMVIFRLCIWMHHMVANGSYSMVNLASRLMLHLDSEPIIQEYQICWMQNVCS